MKVPRVQGTIRRRLLVNFRVDPEVLARRLPPPFRPKLYRDHGIAGICLIRLEQMRPLPLPGDWGLASENAAHRIAVVRDTEAGEEQAVYVPRRDSSSWLNRLVGGRLFPGVHHPASFEVRDDGREVSLRMRSTDGRVSIDVRGAVAVGLPSTSIFASVDDASRFFEGGSLGYSAGRREGLFDGVMLDTEDWRVEPLHVHEVHSSYFEDPERFPPGSVRFDHALVMRNVQHSWRSVPELYGRAVPTTPRG